MKNSASNIICNRVNIDVEWNPKAIIHNHGTKSKSSLVNKDSSPKTHSTFKFQALLEYS